jgi:hypothetical protein
MRMSSAEADLTLQRVASAGGVTSAAGDAMLNPTPVLHPAEHVTARLAPVTGLDHTIPRQSSPRNPVVRRSACGPIHRPALWTCHNRFRRSSSAEMAGLLHGPNPSRFCALTCYPAEPPLT